MGTRNWRQLLDRYQAQWIFIRPNNPLSAKLEKSDTWALAYSDAEAKIFKRSSANTNTQQEDPMPDTVNFADLW